MRFCDSSFWVAYLVKRDVLVNCIILGRANLYIGDTNFTVCLVFKFKFFIFQIPICKLGTGSTPAT